MQLATCFDENWSHSGVSEIADETAVFPSASSVFFWGGELCLIQDRLFGLVVRVLGYRSRGPGSIPGAIRFSEK
jgi:hypothetical protein